MTAKDTSTTPSRSLASSNLRARQTTAALFINIEGFYLLENHAKPVAEAKPGDPKPQLAVASSLEKHEEHEAKVSRRSEA